MIELVKDVEYPYNINYAIDIDGIKFIVASNYIPDYYVYAYNADYNCNYILCGYEKGNRILVNPTNTKEELIYLIPFDVAKKFANFLNERDYIGMDWVIGKY